MELRSHLEAGRYQAALTIVDELEDMSRQSVLRNIESFLVRLLIHLIKNQVEARLTRSWSASITDSIIQISKLNLKGNRSSVYIDRDAWQPYLEEALEEALLPASLEIFEGKLTVNELEACVDADRLFRLANHLLALIYQTSRRELRQQVMQVLEAIQ